MARCRPEQRRRSSGPPVRWIWLWILMVVVIVIMTWNDRGVGGQSHNPVILLILLMTTAVVGYITMRFTRRLRRLSQAVDEISLRDLTTRVSVDGHDAVAALAANFNRMVDRLDAQERVRREFFADLAHEIRHPIALLLGRLESIQDGVIPLNEEQILHLHDMTLGLKRLVTDMNDLALADVGQLSLHLAPVRPDDLCAQIQGNLSPVAEDLNLTFTTATERNMPYVTADQDRLRQVLINLITNAFHQTPAGGTVSLTIRQNGPDAIFEVTDTGSGIHPDDLPHLFERFYRADRSRERIRGGSGLGLTIVRSIAELHGGTVTVESTVGEGSRFVVTLPLVGPTTKSVTGSEDAS